MQKVFKNWRWFEITFLFVSVLTLLVSALICGQSEPINGFPSFMKSIYVSLIAAVFGIFGSTLNYKRSANCFIFYIISGLIYAYVSFAKGNYGETILNVFYLFPSYLISFIGHLKSKNHEKKEVTFENRHVTSKELIVMFCGLIVITVSYGFILKAIHSNYPFLNSLATAVAICCIYMASRHILEQWYSWTIYGIVLFVLWLLTSLTSVTGIPFLLQNVINTVLNVYVIITVLILKKQ